MALRLTGDHNRVEAREQLQQRRIALAADLRPEHRVVLGQWVVALDLEGGLALAGDLVEEDGLLDRRDERVADSAQHRVVRPYRQAVAAAGFQRPDVAEQVLLVRGVRRPPDASLDVVSRDDRVRRRVAAVPVDEPGRVEDLLGPVRVERRHDLRDPSEVPVDELAKAAVVVGRARHEQLEPRRAERVLDVHDEEADPARVVSGGPDPVLLRPRRRLRRARLVRDTPDLLDPAGIPVRWERQLHRVSVLMEARPAADALPDASRLADARGQSGCADLAADLLLRPDHRHPLADDPADAAHEAECGRAELEDRKSTRLNSSHVAISYAVFCL